MGSPIKLPSFAELVEMAESYLPSWLQRPLVALVIFILLVAVAVWGVRTVYDNGSAMVSPQSDSVRKSPPSSLIARANAGASASSSQSLAALPAPIVRHRASKAPHRQISVEVGKVTSQNQKGGVTAGYVGSINQTSEAAD